GIRGSGSIGGGDVRTLLQELESRYEVAVEEHPDGLGRFRRGRGETIGENQVGSGLRRRRTGLRSLRAVSLTIHSVVKFPTPRGIVTLVTRSAIISECRRLERKQMVKQGVNQNINP
ncbi:hypothetical protein Tco_1097487, partial [Tanacetum coccineum]